MSSSETSLCLSLLRITVLILLFLFNRAALLAVSFRTLVMESPQLQSIDIGSDRRDGRSKWTSFEKKAVIILCLYGVLKEVSHLTRGRVPAFPIPVK